MSRGSGSWVGISLVLVVLVGGCAKRSAAGKSGADDALRNFGRALIGKDWPSAYQALHPETRSTITEKQFAPLGANYLSSIGFKADEFLIRSCEEHGADAIAQVRIRGHAANKLRTYKDTFTLKKDATGWGVVLPSYFGKTAAPIKR